MKHLTRKEVNALLAWVEPDCVARETNKNSMLKARIVKKVIQKSITHVKERAAEQRKYDPENTAEGLSCPEAVIRDLVDHIFYELTNNLTVESVFDPSYYIEYNEHGL